MKRGSGPEISLRWIDLLADGKQNSAATGERMQDITLAPLDLAVIAAYFVVVFIIGFRVARRTHSADDLFLAGHRLTWIPIGLSLFASNISSTTLIGLAGAAYTWGIAVANYEWMAAPILVIFAIFLIPLYLNARIGTVPEFLEYRFDRRVRIYFSLLTIFANIVVDTAGTLFAGAIVLGVFIPGLDIVTAALILAAIAGIYTAAGGLAAVVYTDVLQAIILLAGSAIVAVLAFAQLDFSWARLVTEAPPQHLSLMLPLGDDNLPWLGTLVGVPVLGFYFWCTNQFIVQRVLGAHDILNARRGALLAGLLKLPVLFLMVLPGVMAAIFMPGLPQGDAVFPALVGTLLPAGLAGLVMAALVAALMSSIDSTLNSAAALVTLDLVKPLRPGLSPRQTAWLGRCVILLVMLLSALVAPAIGRFEGLFHYLQTALAFLVPPVVVIFLYGVFWRRAGANAALATLIGGHIISAGCFIATLTGVLDLHFTLIAGLIFAISSLIFWLAGLLTAAPLAEQIEKYTWRREIMLATVSGAWWQDYRFFAVVLIALTIWLVAAFW
jgi:SSS family solute:Na+ symporter